LLFGFGWGTIFLVGSYGENPERKERTNVRFR
jgi:hypothetical protein